MNNCTFLGKIKHKQLEAVGNTKRLQLSLAVDSYRRGRGGEKVRDRDYLPLEVWDSAAETIDEFCDPNDLLLVTCLARCDSVKETRFRVTEFKIIPIKDQIEEV